MNNAAASVQVRCDRTMASVAVHTFHTFDRKLPAARQNRAKTQFGAVDLSGIRGCAYRAPSITWLGKENEPRDISGDLRDGHFHRVPATPS